MRPNGPMPGMAVAILLVACLAAGATVPGASRAQEPDERVIALVLGEKVTARDKDRLVERIFGALLDRFATKNGIEPSDDELDTFLLKTKEKERQQQIKFEQDRERLAAELESGTLAAKERKKKEAHLQTIETILETTREMAEQSKEMEARLRPMRRRMARQWVRRWKINKALFAKYGGRIIFQQAGVEPLDAYRDFLKEQERNGAFEIVDKAYEAPFWRYFTNDAMHVFYDKDDGARFIDTPWWMMENPPGK